MNSNFQRMNVLEFFQRRDTSGGKRDVLSDFFELLLLPFRLAKSNLLLFIPEDLERTSEGHSEDQLMHPDNQMNVCVDDFANLQIKLPNSHHLFSNLNTFRLTRSKFLSDVRFLD